MSSSQSSQESNDSLSTEDSYEARYHRLAASLEEKEKSKKGGPDNDSSGLGRGFRKVIDLFAEISDLVILADQYEVSLADPLEMDASDFLDDEARERHEKGQLEKKRAYNSVRLLPDLIPNFQATINKPEPAEVKRFYSEIQKGSVDGRSDDIHKLRAAVANWINAAWRCIPALDTDTRTNRGLQHHTCGMLLCPIDYDWELESVRESIRNKEEGYELTMFARALYSGYSGDENDHDTGYLRSTLLLKVYRHIFTSPSSAQGVDASAIIDDPNNIQPVKGKKASRKTVAAGLHMKEVTSRSIAYAAIMLLFALSSATQWTPSHDGMEFNEIYYEIVDYFDEVKKEDAHVVRDLLEWWNSMVFPDRAVHVRKSGVSAKKLAAEREARRNRAASSVN